MVWTKVETSGTGPSPRFYHSATLVGTNKLWVHGGWTGYARENDFFVLDLGMGILFFPGSCFFFSFHEIFPLIGK